MSDPEKLREEANKLANSGGGFFSKLLKDLIYKNSFLKEDAEMKLH